MNQKQIAQMIPAEYRREILDTNMINRASAHTGDASMNYLGVIWNNYIAPEENLSCSLCLERVLSNFKSLQPYLIELEKESKLLSEL